MDHHLFEYLTTHGIPCYRTEVTIAPEALQFRGTEFNRLVRAGGRLAKHMPSTRMHCSGQPCCSLQHPGRQSLRALPHTAGLRLLRAGAVQGAGDQGGDGGGVQHLVLRH